jgi:uncharacterized protein YjbI with pentapeptide repeats
LDVARPRRPLGPDCAPGAKRVVFTDMFAPRPCATKSCNRPALTGSSSCAVHTAGAAQHVAALLQRKDGALSLRDLDLVGVRVEDADLSGADISGCRLTAATFVRVSFKSARIDLSFLDRAVFEDCDFSQGVMQNSVFAGSRLRNCSFQDSEIVQVNFLGIQGEGVRFDHSNLYGSRFIGAVLESVTMRDCNLTRTFFDAGHRNAVDFHSSNTNEAAFQEQPA